MPSDPLEDAVYLKVAETIEDNYRDTTGGYIVSPSAVASLATRAALVAIEEQGMVIVDWTDLDAYVNRGKDLPREVLALNKLRAALSGTAPQPSGTPQDAQTAGGGISRSDTPDASTGLSGAHAEEAEEALDSAQQALARVVQHAQNLAGYRPVEADALAAVILNLDPRHCPPGAALAALTPITEESAHD
jgi:hypothetical protein